MYSQLRVSFWSEFVALPGDLVHIWELFAN